VKKKEMTSSALEERLGAGGWALERAGERNIHV